MRSDPGSRPSSRISRSGFTLVEVLVAVGLTSLLMAALYSAMNIYWTTAVDSFDELERGQIARALLRDMARDIQSVTFVEQQTMESDEESEETEPVDADTAMSSYTNGLFGTSTDLVLYISRPDRTSSYIPTQEIRSPTDRSGDAMIVRYFLAEKGAGGLPGIMGNEDSNLPSTDTVVGLGRMKGDLAGLSLAISVGDLEQQKLAASIIAREVSAIKFEYWDGVEAVAEWDSTEQNMMPQAIIVELTLRTLQDEFDDRRIEDIPDWLDDTTHRLVIPIPVASPYVGESAF